MASLWILDGHEESIDYSIMDGERCGVVRSFKKDGRILFDEDEGIEEENWEGDLIETVLRLGFNDGSNQKCEHGFNAFVLRLADEGKINLVNPDG